MNNLCRLSAIKADNAGTAGTTVLDTTYLRGVEQVSREFEREIGRAMYATQATRYFDGTGADALWLGQDLISITTLKVDDDSDYTYGLTLAADTDYWLWPDNETPKRRIDLNHLSTNLTTWTTGRRRIQIVGLFGYSNETEAAGTIAVAISTTSATSATMTAGHTVEAGDTIWIDSEQLYVSAVATNTLTVVRGVNGTTAATHLILAPVTVRRYPRDVEAVIASRAVMKRWDTQSGFQGAMAEGSNDRREAIGQWFGAIKEYQRVVV